MPKTAQVWTFSQSGITELVRMHLHPFVDTVNLFSVAKCTVALKCELHQQINRRKNVFH